MLGANLKPETALATPNYAYEKRQKELAKKRKQEEKRQKKLERKDEPGGTPQPPGDDTPPAPAEGDNAA
jgi:hypothetical protein